MEDHRTHINQKEDVKVEEDAKRKNSGTWKKTFQKYD